MSLPTIWRAASCARLALVLAHFLWQGTAVALLASGAAAAMRRASARARYALWAAAMAAMLLCPLATYLAVNPAEGAAAPVRLAARLPAPAAVWGSPAVRLAVEPADAMTPARGIDTGQVSLLARIGTWSRRTARTGGHYLVAAYLLGVLLMFLRLALVLFSGRRLLRASMPAGDDDLLAMVSRQARAIGLAAAPAVAFCRKIVAPTVIGVLRPTVLLPLSVSSGLSPGQVEALLTHELAHIRRYDHLVHLLQQIAEAMLFFHPAVWHVSRRIRRERENSCDDVVLASGGEPTAYASSLLKMAERGLARRRGLAAGLAAAGRPSELRRRISRLLGESPPCSIRLSRTGCVALVLAVAVGLVAGSYLFAQAEPRPTPAPAVVDPVGRERLQGLRDQEKQIDSRLAQMRGRLGPRHGEVLRLEAERDRTGKESAAIEAAAAMPPRPAADAVTVASSTAPPLTDLPGMPVHRYGIPGLLAALKVAGETKLSEQQARAELIRRLQRQVAAGSWAPKGAAARVVRDLLSWSGNGKADLRIMRDALMVRQTPENHVRVLKWLNDLQEKLNVQIHIAVVVLRLPEAADAAFRTWLRQEKLAAPEPTSGGVEVLLLPGERVDEIRKRLSREKSARIVATPQVLVIQGETSAMTVGGDIPVVIPPVGGPAKPLETTVFSGLDLKIEPSTAAGGKQITLAVGMSFREVEQKGKRLEQDLARGDVTVRTRPPQAVLLRVPVARFDVTADRGTRFGPGGSMPQIILRTIPQPEGRTRYVYFLIRAGRFPPPAVPAGKPRGRRIGP